MPGNSYGSTGKPQGGFLNTPTLVAVLVLILTGPDFFNQLSRWLWPFIENRWGADMAPVAFFCAWAIIIPASFTLLRAGFQSSIGLFAIWIADKIF